MQSVRRRRWKGAGANGDSAGGRTSGQDWRSHKGNTQDTRLLSQLRPWTLQTENSMRKTIRGIITRATLRIPNSCLPRLWTHWKMLIKKANLSDEVSSYC